MHSAHFTVRVLGKHLKAVENNLQIQCMAVRARANTAYRGDRQPTEMVSFTINVYGRTLADVERVSSRISNQVLALRAED